MMIKSVQELKRWLIQPDSPHILGLFRIVFGIFMTYEILDYIRIGLVKNMFVLPAINFRYDYLKWLKPLPELWLNIILGLILVCAICITLGIFFKWACRIFAAGYLYIFLLDKSIYNNHIYLFILLAFLLSFTDADKVLSLAAKKIKTFSIPHWQLFLLQLQIVIVYFYGGLAKLKYDWIMNCQPMRSLISGIPEAHFLAPILKNDFGIYLFNYGGLLIDLGAPFWLWNKSLRKWAIIPIIIFHIINSIIFRDIGIFPFVMLACLILFYTHEEIPFLAFIWKKTGTKQQIKKKQLQQTYGIKMPSKPVMIVLGAYIGFQLLFPLRGYFLPNNMDWTTIGNRFSWRMKVDTRQINEMSFSVLNEQNVPMPVEIQKLVNDMQILNLSMDPRSVADFALMLNAKAVEMNLPDAQVKASIKVDYNGKGIQYFIDPEEDLTTVQYNPFKLLEWVTPLKE